MVHSSLPAREVGTARTGVLAAAVADQLAMARTGKPRARPAVAGLLFTSVLLLGIAGCSSSDDDSSNVPPDDGSGVPGAGGDTGQGGGTGNGAGTGQGGDTGDQAISQFGQSCDVEPVVNVETTPDVETTETDTGGFGAEGDVDLGYRPEEQTDVVVPACADLAWMNMALEPGARADALLPAMSLDQKIEQLYNFPVLNRELQDEDPPCDFAPVGRHIEGIPELRIPTMRMTNGGNGIRSGDCKPETTATALPSAVANAANFEPDIAFRWGQVIGKETRSWAHHVLYGPVVNIIRTPWGGRNHQAFSEDPYLTGVMGSQVVRGIQSSGETQSAIKHFAGNETEYQRERWTAASRIPARAMHEIYLLPFEMAVKDADVASFMCAFPYLNDEWACQNGALLQTTLRDRWGFDGHVGSDRRSMHSTVLSLQAGVGFELDFSPIHYTPALIKTAIDAGEIAEADIDALLRQRYVKMFEYGQFDDRYDSFLPADLDAHAEVARAAADGGIVLLKNDGLLPLGTDAQSIALIGAQWFAGEATLPPRSINRDDTEGVMTELAVSPQKGLENTLAALGSNATVNYSSGERIDEAVEAAQNADIAVVIVGDQPRESWDKLTLSFPTIQGTDQGELVPRILEANPNTVVVIKTSGSVLMPWLEDAPAVVEAWYPGQSDGDAVADVLFGVTNPSGKLPMTFGNTDKEAAYETDAQYPGLLVDNGLGGGEGGFNIDGSPQRVTEYKENLAVGYRWYEAENVTPVFPFGHGLSYTTFTYDDLQVTSAAGATGGTTLTVGYTVFNTGERAGREASQVYLTLPAEAGQPAKRLVGFDKVDLQPGTSERVTVTIDCAASNHPLSYFVPEDEADLQKWAQGDWMAAAGTYGVSVGGSSADTPLQSSIDISPSGCEVATAK